MKTKNINFLTQKELVAELHKLGIADITLRRIIDWKEKSLLPPFDDKGRGLGKGRGKVTSRWKNRRLVVEQAVWVHRLLGIYRYANELYFPLWLLGYTIPIRLVRKALLEPLEKLNGMFETEALEKLEKVEPYERTNGIVEDYIGDLVFNWINKDKISEIFGTPQEVVETPINIFFNPDYEINDVGFEDGVAALTEWKENFEKEIIPILLQGLEENSQRGKQSFRPDVIELIFDNATFFQEHLSVPQLYKFVNEATEEDFRQVQTDMQVVHAIVDSLGRAISILMRDVSGFPKPTLDELLPILLQLGNLLALTDISMRRNGWSERFNWRRAEIIEKLREDFNEETEKALTEASPIYSEAFEKGLKTLKKNFEDLIEAKTQIPPKC